MWGSERPDDGARRSARDRRLRERLGRPAGLIAAGFGLLVLTGTGLLMLPFAAEEGESTTFVQALFTATSAGCITGLTVVETGGHWSTFGEVVILAMMQIGGLGIMTMATLLALVLSRRLGLRARLLLQAETKALRLQDVRRVWAGILVFSLGTEAVVALILGLRFGLAHDMPAGQASYHGVFHAVSAFNSGGMSLNSDSLIGYVGDPVIGLTVSAAVVLGGTGYLVVLELVRGWRRPREWSVLTRITLMFSGGLLVLGTVVLTATEWDNPRTLAPLSVPDKLVAGLFAAVMPRSGGLNTVETGEMSEESLLTQIMLMFIGGGSTSTAGGIKVTTFGLLAYVIWAEVRGQAGVHVGRRRIPDSNQRQALAIALLGVGFVAGGTLVLLALTEHHLLSVLFEVTSAFGTVGLSMGITAELGQAGQLLLVGLMFVGRIGPLTLASALALRERDRRYQLPEERTIVG